MFNYRPCHNLATQACEKGTRSGGTSSKTVVGVGEVLFTSGVQESRKELRGVRSCTKCKGMACTLRMDRPGLQQSNGHLFAQAKQQIKVLSARYRCRPLPTMLLPPLLHIPVFISTTFTIREACRRSSVSLQTSLQALQDGKAAIVGDGGVCNLALESFAWCPSLTDVDPYSLLPVMVGLTALLNVEMQARIRQALVAARELAVTQEAEANEVSNGQATGIGQEATNRGTVNVRPRPPVRPAAIRASVLQKNTLTTSTRTCLPTHSSSIKSRDSTSGSRSPTVSASSARQSGITNVLRFASIVFIPVAAISPVVRCCSRQTAYLFHTDASHSFR